MSKARLGGQHKKMQGSHNPAQCRRAIFKMILVLQLRDIRFTTNHTADLILWMLSQVMGFESAVLCGGVMAYSTDIGPFSRVCSNVHSKMTFLHGGVGAMRTEERLLLGMLSHHVFSQVYLLSVNSSTEGTAKR